MITNSWPGIVVIRWSWPGSPTLSLLILQRALFGCKELKKSRMNSKNIIIKETPFASPAYKRRFTPFGKRIFPSPSSSPTLRKCGRKLTISDISLLAPAMFLVLATFFAPSKPIETTIMLSPSSKVLMNSMRRFAHKLCLWNLTHILTRFFRCWYNKRHNTLLQVTLTRLLHNSINSSQNNEPRIPVSSLQTLEEVKI